MAKLTDLLTEERLNKAIWTVASLIVIGLLVLGGYAFYINFPTSHVPPLVQRAIDEARKAIAQDPNNVNLRVQLAQVYVSSGMYNEAITELNQALKLNKDHPGALTYLGIAYYQQGKVKQAIPLLKKAISLSETGEFKGIDPYLYEAQYQLGTIYLEQKNYDEAIAVLDGGVKLNPLDSDMHCQLGRAYLGKKNADAAITHFEAAVKYVPNFAEAYFGLGQAYEMKGEEGKAAASYEKALKYKSNYPEAQRALSRLK